MVLAEFRRLFQRVNNTAFIEGVNRLAVAHQHVVSGQFEDAGQAACLGQGIRVFRFAALVLFLAAGGSRTVKGPCLVSDVVPLQQRVCGQALGNQAVAGLRPVVHADAVRVREAKALVHCASVDVCKLENRGRGGWAALAALDVAGGRSQHVAGHVVRQVAATKGEHDGLHGLQSPRREGQHIVLAGDLQEHGPKGREVAGVRIRLVLEYRLAQGSQQFAVQVMVAVRNVPFEPGA